MGSVPPPAGASSKAAMESLGLALHAETELPVRVVRFFNTSGPRQSATSGMVLPTLIESALAGRDLRVSKKSKAAGLGSGICGSKFVGGFSWGNFALGPAEIQEMFTRITAQSVQGRAAQPGKGSSAPTQSGFCSIGLTLNKIRPNIALRLLHFGLIE